MCGIVAFLTVPEGNVVPRLLRGLERLEYRGYDSAGLAVLTPEGRLAARRTVGKVSALREAVAREPLHGPVGIAHTRWATHGGPSVRNAHPQFSGTSLALVHNGIIENHAALRAELESDGFTFASETDSEVIVHLVRRFRDRGAPLAEAVAETRRRLEGAYAFVVLDRDSPGTLVGAREGCPLVVGHPDPDGELLGALASDPAALAGFASRVVYLEDGDVVRVHGGAVDLVDRAGRAAARAVHVNPCSPDALERGPYRHYMLKEIHEQPEAVRRTLESRLVHGHVPDEAFGPNAVDVLPRVRAVHLVACGTSHHAALLARRTLTRLAGVPTLVEIASEFRYQTPPIEPATLLVAVSQSGETADTLAAVRHARGLPYEGSLAVCNVAGSTLVREASLALLTRAGPEIGVASTKAFTTQVVGLHLLALALARHRGVPADRLAEAAGSLDALPDALRALLEVEETFRDAAEELAESDEALYIGRGDHHPVALEGALKLKEISYIYAEGLPAGELKHGPLALVDHRMPVIALVPRGELFEKMVSNVAEVAARGGRLYLLTDAAEEVPAFPNSRLLRLPGPWPALVSPLVYAVALQLLAYHTAVAKGTDVDQPRNLAKSVTVE